MTAWSEAWRGVRLDQDVLSRVGGAAYRRRSRLLELVLNPSLKAGFFMRLATASGPRLVRIWARQRLIGAFSCDINPSARIQGGIYLPHPVGIVIGAGASIADGARIYQHVTIGAGRGSQYPTVARDATIYPNAVVVGGITIGERARVGAGSFVDQDVPADGTYRGHTRAAGHRD